MKQISVVSVAYHWNKDSTKMCLLQENNIRMALLKVIKDVTALLKGVKPTAIER